MNSRTCVYLASAILLSGSAVAHPSSTVQIDLDSLGKPQKADPLPTGTSIFTVCNNLGMKKHSPHIGEHLKMLDKIELSQVGGLGEVKLVTNDATRRKDLIVVGDASMLIGGGSFEHEIEGTGNKEFLPHLVVLSYKKATSEVTVPPPAMGCAQPGQRNRLRISFCYLVEEDGESHVKCAGPDLHYGHVHAEN